MVGFDPTFPAPAGRQAAGRNKELMFSIYTIPSIPVCPRLPDGQGQAGMLGFSNGAKGRLVG